jgi:hypothetical protein
MSDMTTPTPIESPAPRIRFAAIVWGLIYAVIAVTVITLLIDPERRDSVAAFLWSLDGPTLLLLALVSAGFLMLVLGALTAVRRAQGRRATSS